MDFRDACRVQQGGHGFGTAMPCFPVKSLSAISCQPAGGYSLSKGALPRQFEALELLEDRSISTPFEWHSGDFQRHQLRLIQTPSRVLIALALPAQRSTHFHRPGQQSGAPSSLNLRVVRATQRPVGRAKLRLSREPGRTLFGRCGSLSLIAPSIRASIHPRCSLAPRRSDRRSDQRHRTGDVADISLS